VTKASATPLMQQYREIKSRHEDAILLFRMGDFYEMFYDDAETASRVLGLTLTSRNNGGAAEVPLAGVPVKALNEYLRRLVQHGFRVAICEQVEDPRVARGIVRREVVETITPGAAFSDDLLEGGRNNFLCAVLPPEEGRSHANVAAVDVSTGTLRLASVPAAELLSVIGRFAPRELLVPRERSVTSSIAGDALVTERDLWEFDVEMGRQALERHYAIHSLSGLGFGEDDAGLVGVAGALLRYLKELQPGGLPHLARPVIERAGGVLPLDEMTRRNLELVESLRGGERSGTLLDVLDRTLTPMGARLLRERVLTPLAERLTIDSRLDAVAALHDDALARAAIRETLDGVRDLERLAGRTASGRASPRDVRSLGDSLSRLPALKEHLLKIASGRRSGALEPIAREFDTCDDLCGEILNTLVERPPAAIGEDSETIARGVDIALDALRDLRSGGKDSIAAIQEEERARTGISSLRVGYNRVFGYYLEVTNSNRHLVPPDWQRRQTLTGAERYVTPALKEYEEKVLGAEEKILERERAIFDELRRRIGSAIVRLQHAASAVAELDFFGSLAEVAAREGYNRPELHDGFELEIVAGRHPVVERMMPREKFIPNDVAFAPDARVIIVTGPNMAGKSTVLRQTGLIVLMAQMGGYVPAARARIGIIDRLFTRVGASDNLVRGQSTFMVEMSETSAILQTATARSLVLLDEVGRGTSTYDGVSIAWSVSEHLHDRIGCKTIFATHYHELTQLASELSGVRNYNVAVRETADSVVFLHRLQPGGADRSYGIEVGRLAGLPAEVVSRARDVLSQLEKEGSGLVRSLSVPRSAPTDQLTLFGSAPHPVIAKLRNLRIEEMTPLQALAVLDTLVRECNSDSPA
jgi:DNA mismatch repair protein MutS